MKFERSAGILLHPTSLPGPYGIGDLGSEAYKFVDFLEAAGQKLWQVLPLGPTGYGDSPYQTFSAFAGNSLLVSPERLLQENLLGDEDLRSSPHFDPTCIDFGKLISFKMNLLKKAFDKFFESKKHETDPAFKTFCSSNAGWLEHFSSFMAFKDHHEGKLWTGWDRRLVIREKSALKEWADKLSKDILFHKFVQYMFDKQWQELKKYANDKGIKIVGDLPIFVAYDSSDVWANKELFDIDENGALLTKAGVPPDYFSPTGQLPPYRRQWFTFVSPFASLSVGRLGRRPPHALQLLDGLPQHLRDLAFTKGPCRALRPGAFAQAHRQFQLAAIERVR
jgi:4-alpha-glucanotransferase